MNTLISIGCIITDQLYSPLWSYETTKISKKSLKTRILRQEIIRISKFTQIYRWIKKTGVNLQMTESKKFLLNFFTSEEQTKAFSLTLFNSGHLILSDSAISHN